MRGRHPLPALGLAVLLCQCAATPPGAAPLAPGDELTVVYASPSATLALRNRGSMTREAAYSDGSMAGLKIADDDQLDKLLEGFARSSFYDHAAGGAYPSANETLTVERGGKTWVFSRLPLTVENQAQVNDFQQCVAVFRYVYDSTRSYHTEKMTADQLEAENERIRQRNAEAMRLRGRK